MRIRTTSITAALAVLVLVMTATPVPAGADAPNLPQLPIALDVSKVPVGAWAEYAVTGARQASTIRWSVVARDREGTTLEVSLPDAALGKGKRGTLVQRVTIPAQGHAKAAIQIADADPLALPAKRAPRLAAIDARYKAGQETITVAAGTFNTTKYRQVTPHGTLEYWVADRAPPLGVVKLAITFPSAMRVVKKRASGTVAMELVKTGGNATAAIVKLPVALEARSLAAIRAKLATSPKPASVRPITPIKPIKPRGTQP